MVLGSAGIIMLFVSTGWKWGLAGIAGYWFLLILSMVFWHKRFSILLARGENPRSSGRGR